jgi:hypothetical protein
MRAAVVRIVAYALLATGCGQGASYGLGYGVQTGAAALPPTASRGTTAMLTYHEFGGVVARTIILVVAAMGLKNPAGDRSTSTDVKSETVGNTTYVTTTTTTTFTPTTPEERAAREAAIANFSQNVAPGIMHGEFPVELNLGFARTSLGGDTSGHTFEMLFHVSSERSDLGLGFGLTELTFHGRSYADVVDLGGTLMRVMKTGDLDYSFAGFPVRLTQGVLPRTSLFLQWDLNVKTLTDGAPSPMTLGVLYQLPVLSLRGTVRNDRLELGATSVGAEVILGF